MESQPCNTISSPGTDVCSGSVQHLSHKGPCPQLGSSQSSSTIHNKIGVFQLEESHFSMETFQEQALQGVLGTLEQSQTLEGSLKGWEGIEGSPTLLLTFYF